MSFIRRALLVIVGLLLTGTGIFILLATAHPIGWAGYYLAQHFEEVVLLFAGGALGLLGLILLVVGFFPPKKEPEALVYSGDLGAVHVTRVALENMVLRVVQQTKGVRGSSRRVLATPQGLVVNLEIKVAVDQNLPDLTGALQKEIKDYLEEITGIIVSEVKVKVENIILDQVPMKVK